MLGFPAERKPELAIRYPLAKLAHRNCSAYEGIAVLPYAFWGQNEHLNLRLRAAEAGCLVSWGSRTVPTAEAPAGNTPELRAVTIDWVMET